MGNFTYHRQVRTLTSESYEVREADHRLGRIDLHFAAQEVYGTLVLERESDEGQILGIIESIDEDLVLSSEMPRQDFLVSVYHGHDSGFYNDDFLRERMAQAGEGNGVVAP